MKVATHIDKFRRLDAALTRLRADVDYELWVWTAMNACVNLLNAALHKSGLTDETDSHAAPLARQMRCPKFNLLYLPL